MMNRVLFVMILTMFWENGKRLKKFFQFSIDTGTFDAAFSNDFPLSERTCVVCEGLDDELSELEAARALMKAKPKKAVWIDNLPYKILQNVNTKEMLHILFSEIFEMGVTPSIWKISIIKPIPKNLLIDPWLPLQYRGISLLSTVLQNFQQYTKPENNKLCWRTWAVSGLTKWFPGRKVMSGSYLLIV